MATGSSAVAGGKCVPTVREWDDSHTTVKQHNNDNIVVVPVQHPSGSSYKNVAKINEKHSTGLK